MGGETGRSEWFSSIGRYCSNEILDRENAVLWFISDACWPCVHISYSEGSQAVNEATRLDYPGWTYVRTEVS